MVTTDVATYFAEGCGRCEHFQTPQCKVHLWTDALQELRSLILAAGLEETMKWGSPTYTIEGCGNVVMLTSFRAYCALSFPRGSLLTDPDGVLEAPGPNSQGGRLFKFTDVQQVRDQAERIRSTLAEAIEIHRSGRKVVFAERPEPIPDELQARLDDDPALEAAFEALTPGRQRSHIIYVGGAKQSGTRERRVEKCVPKILDGKGFLDR